jgi:hypothetical protein
MSSMWAPGLAVLVRGADFTLVYDAGSNDDLARRPGNCMLGGLQQGSCSFIALNV